MRFKSKATTAFLTLILFFSMLMMLRSTNAQGGPLQVYIINLNGVGDDNTGWVTSRADIVYGALNACAINGQEMEYNVPWFHADEASYPQFYDVQVNVITSWDIYTQVITGAALNDREGLIFLNAHGQIFPVPTGYTKQAWMGIITNLMLHYRATWISTNGYPFSQVVYRNGTQETWGVGGFDYFMSFINLQGRQCSPPPGGEDQIAQFDSGFGQNVALYRFPCIGIGDECTWGKPLNYSDFMQNMEMRPFWASPQANVTYVPVGVLTYASPGTYNNTHGFGSYVHIGAKKIYDNYYSSDWERGYVAMAASLYRSASGFAGSQCSGSWQNTYRSNNVANYGLAVCPNIAAISAPPNSGYYTVGIAFPITVALNESYWANGGTSASLWGSQVSFDMDINSPNFSNVQVMLDTGMSVFGNATVPSGTVFTLPFGLGNLSEADCERLSNDIQFGLSYVPVVGSILGVANGIQLWSQWWVAPNMQNGTGVGRYGSIIHFVWNVPNDDVAHHQVSNNDPLQTYNITEQASVSFYVDLKVPTSSYAGWYKMPLQYNMTITPGSAQGGHFLSTATVMNTSQLDLYFPSANRTGQCDAGQSGDAGDVPSQARTIAYPTSGTTDYYGYLCYYNSADKDLCDWYDFSISSATTVTIVLLPPVLACYNLSLYSSSNWNTPVAQCNSPGDGIQQTVQYSAGAGTWYIDVCRVDGSGIYKLTLGRSGGGGGCPFVCPWNGTAYVVDNNILPLAECSNGSDVQDYYKLEQPLLPNRTGSSFSTYSLEISEFENEHDYLDQVKMYAVDHSQNVNVGVSPSGQILTYQNPQSPLLAQDENGRDWTQTLSSIGNNYYQSEPGDYLTLYFGHVDASNAKLVMREDPPAGPAIKESIYVQLLMLNGSWAQIADIPGRANMSTDVIDFSGYLQAAWNPIEVRLYFTAVHRVEFVGLDTTPQATVQTIQAQLVSAVNSANNNVLRQLTLNDGVYAQLTPGQQITLTFLLPNTNADKTRTFIFYVEGHYYTIKP